MLTSFRLRTIILFSGLLLISQGMFFIAYDQQNIGNAHRETLQSISTSQKVFENVLRTRFDRLNNIVQIMVADYGFRSALSLGEAETIFSTLANHSRRVGADLMVAMDGKGSALSAYPRNVMGGINEVMDGLKDESGSFKLEGDQIALVATIAGEPYQIVIVPLKSAHLNAYVAVGFKITEGLAEDIKRITNSEISFMRLSNPTKRAKDTRVEVLASTHLDAVHEASLQTQLQYKQGDDYFSLHIDDIEYISYLIPIFEATEGTFYALMQKPWSSVLQAQMRHRIVVLSMALAFLLVSIIVAVLFSRQVTGPVSALLKAIRRVEKGNFDYRIQTTRKDELGTLINGFNSMVKGLGEREKMKHMALHDGLTGLPNRRKFNKVVEESIKRQDNEDIASAVLLLDLDGFKQINDTLGHAAGDEVLKTIAQRLGLTSMRDEDIAARLGGDEFAVIYEGVDSAEVAKMRAGEILTRVNEPITFEGKDASVGCSIGIAMTEVGMLSSEWLELADKSCYVAKEHGKNAYCFEEGPVVELASLKH